MIAQNSVGTNIHRELGAEKLQAIHDPLFAMIVVLTTDWVITTKKGPSNTAGNTVIVRREIQIDFVFSGNRHGLLSLGAIQWVTF